MIGMNNKFKIYPQGEKKRLNFESAESDFILKIKGAF